MTIKRLLLGSSGEGEAVRCLKEHGYRIIEKNYRCRYGEIDIIASDRGTIAFVEVKTRSSDAYGTPGEGVDRRKQLHITRASLQYMSENNITDRDARFDVVSIMRGRGGLEPELIKDAFSADVLDEC